MSVPHNYVDLEFPSLPENVSFARTAAALFASQLDFTLDEIDEIKVAVSEAVSNAVVHGYGRAVGLIRMRASIEGEALVVTVHDEGLGIEDVDWAQQPSHTTAPEEHMGLGLVFIKEYMNDVAVESQTGQGTRVRMVKIPAHTPGSPAGGRPAGEPIRH